MNTDEQKRALKKKGRNRDTGSVVPFGLRAGDDACYVINELSPSAGSLRGLYEQAIDAVYDMFKRDTADGDIKAQIRQLCYATRTERGTDGKKQQRGTVISREHDKKALEITSTVLGVNRTEVVFVGLSILKKLRAPKLEVSEVEHKWLIRLLQKPLRAEWHRKVCVGKKFPPLSMIPNNKPLLIDSWIILFSILGHQEINQRLPISFSRSANALLFKRAATPRLPTMISSLELPRLIEYLRRSSGLEKVHEQNEKKGWRPEKQEATDLQIVLDAVLNSFLQIVDVSQADCQATALHYGSARNDDRVFLPAQHGGDGFLQVACASHLHPGGFSIATCSDCFDHVDTKRFPVFKPDDLAAFQAKLETLPENCGESMNA